MTTENNPKKTALRLILLFGFVSLLGDIIYEGARSVNGPYLQVLGANAAIVGAMAGIGEFLGYALRLLSGYLSDKTKSYWTFVFLGYGMLFSVPLLSLTGFWQIAAVLILMERMGKALRSPAKDTIISQAGKQVGTGFAFGLHEAMDQIGAILGPMIFSVAFYLLGEGQRTTLEYQRVYSFLWIPFGLLMGCIFWGYLSVPHPERLEDPKKTQEENCTKIFWLYTIFSLVTTAGFVPFILMAYHFKTKGILTDAQIPLFYAIAMAVDAVVALVIGKVYDTLKQKQNNPKAGINTLFVLPLFSLLIPMFAFSSDYTFAVLSVLFWGIAMAIHETVMRSAIADITPLKKRGTGYGIFNTSYGLGMLLGGFIMGMLYEYSTMSLILFSLTLEILAIPIFFLLKKETNIQAN
mgnify:FL=1